MSPAPEGTPFSETGITVRSSELDSFGHVNNAVFLNYLEHGRFEALERAGFTFSMLEERGWGLFVVRIEIDYVSEATRGNRLLVRTWADSFRRTSMVLAQEIVREEDPETVVARSVTTTVWMGPNRKPIRVPDEVRARLLGTAAAVR